MDYREEKVDKVLARGSIEAALFISGQPVSVEDLCTRLSLPKSLVMEVLQEFLRGHWAVTSLEIVPVGEDTYIMQVGSEYTSKVKSFAMGGTIPEEVMRTLIVIALEQPVPLLKIVHIRGSGVLEHVKNLQERGLVRAEGSGENETISTTTKFAAMFGLDQNVDKMRTQLRVQLGRKD